MASDPYPCHKGASLCSAAFAGCDVIGLESGDCYVDDYRILSVVDGNGVEYEPEKLTLVTFGILEHNYCGIPSDAKPLYAERYPYFIVEDVVDARTSLAGIERSSLDAVVVGTSQGRGEFRDDLSMWPLHDSEWR